MKISKRLARCLDGHDYEVRDYYKGYDGWHVCTTCLKCGRRRDSAATPDGLRLIAKMENGGKPAIDKPENEGRCAKCRKIHLLDVLGLCGFCGYTHVEPIYTRG